MREYFKKAVDWVAMPVGCLAMALMFMCPEQRISTLLVCVAGIFGLGYALYAAWLWFVRRVDFDWHLINGHFLRKVICLVVSVPSVITMFLIICNCESPKAEELVYDDNLYEQKEFPESLKSKQEDPSFFWTVYFHFIDPGNQHMTSTPYGRALAAVIAILGVFLLNGLLVSSIIGWIDRRKERWQNGDIDYHFRYLGKYRYAVVIGANEIAASVIKNLFTPRKEGEISYKCEGNNQYVVLQTSRKVEDVRAELASHLTENDLKRVVIYKALRDSCSELKKLHAEYATEIYVLGESTLADGGETYHDAMNMRCVNLLSEGLDETRLRREKETNGKSVKKVCKVMFEYQTTTSIFQFSDIPECVKNNLVFIPFNRYESWARAVIADNTAIEDCNVENGKRLSYTPLDGEKGIAEDDMSHVHLVIVGMSKMGIAMGVQAMLQAHYLNYAKVEDQKGDWKDKLRTRITFIDTHADKEMAFFKGRYENLFSLTRHRYLGANCCDEKALAADSLYCWNDPMTSTEGTGQCWKHLSDNGTNFIDMEIEFIKGELESEGVRTYLRNISDKSNPWVKDSILTVAVCLTQTHQAVAAGLYMPVAVYEKAQEIWVYQRESADIVLNLINTIQSDKRYKKLRPFGMLYGEYMNDRSQYLKSLLVNGAYDLDGMIDGKEIKAGERDLAKKETYSDLRASWKKLSIDKKFSNRYFADSIPLKIRSVMACDPAATLEEAISRHTLPLAVSEHNRWNVQQLLLGYSPCPEDIDAEFVNLNSAYKTASDNLKAWRKKVGWNNLSEADKEKLQKTDEDCRELEQANAAAKDAFKTMKNNKKVGEDRMHPNICAFNHLNDVDFEAEGYDVKLNSNIPVIKLLVDDRIKGASVRT